MSDKAFVIPLVTGFIQIDFSTLSYQYALLPRRAVNKIAAKISIRRRILYPQIWGYGKK